MTKHSLRTRILVLVLIPTLLLGALLSTFIIAHQYKQSREQIVAKNRDFIESLSLLNANHTTQQDAFLIEKRIKFLQHKMETDLHTLQRQKYQAFFSTLLLIVLTLCTAGLFAHRLVSKLTQPLHNMAQSINNICQGEWSHLIKDDMLPELDQLKQAINTMLLSLLNQREAMQKNIEHATLELRETLKKLEKQNIELEFAEKRATEAARIKAEFLANMSHELRTPLNGVIGFTQQVLKTTLTATQTDYLLIIHRSAKNLLIIINDVLDFSKLEADRLQLEHVPFSLRESLDETAVLLAHSAHEKGIDITVTINNDLPDTLIGDPLRLQQIVTNLLGNAIKFTEQGNIEITAKVRQRYHTEIDLEIQVCDSGIGIAEHQQSELFQAFRQADTSISRRHGGSGLGLVITQKLVKAMGGEIDFYSQPNQGSTFWFYVRLASAASQNVLPIMNELQQRLAHQSLLLIEDNPISAHAIQQMLSKTPLTVTHFNHLSDAQLAQKTQQDSPFFDILLLSVSIAQRHNLSLYKQNLAIAGTLAKRIIPILPTQSSINAEHIDDQQIPASLIKPLAEPRLFHALLSTDLLTGGTKTKSLSDLQVMAVDDNPANLKLIGALLNDTVSQVFLCHSAHEAIETAQQHPIDVILMDIQMPEIDGIQAAKQIHQLPQHANTPIIAVTAYTVSGERERLLNAGMSQFLSKPVDENTLINALTHCLISPFTPVPASEAVQVISTLENDHAITPQTPVLDWSQALQRSAGKDDLARDLLSMLLAFLPDVVEQIEQFMAGKQNDSLLDLIHKLHGSCSYCGVPRLQQSCRRLETELRKGTKPTDLEPEWLELLDQITHVQQAANEKLTPP